MLLLERSIAAPALIALMPAVVTWWRSRALVRRLDDAALRERLLSSQRANGSILGIAVAVLAINWTNSIWWSIPLLFLARLASTHQLRRALFRETWSLGGHLSFFIRLIVAMFGFWLLLALAPSLIALDTAHQWIVTAVLVTVLLAWAARHTEVVCLLLRAKPLNDPVLDARFARLVNACTIRTPRFLRVNLNGGVFANAVALPSLRQPRVLFSDTLLTSLDHDEIEAICAHELAHIEQFNVRRLRTTAVINGTLIAIIAAMPLVRELSPSAASGLPYVWPILLVVALAMRARHRQQNETAADLRAVALTGNPDALARALTTLYAVAHIPRRYESQRERQATHPSLARRIKAIREAAGTPPASLHDPEVFTSAAASAVFRDDALEWIEGSAARHSLSYAHITELRVDARHTGPAKLVVIDASGRRWELPLADGDVVRAQTVMDIVDGRTAGPPPSPPVSPATARAVAMAVAALAASLTHFSTALVALVAALFPTPPLAVASALAAIATAAVTFRDGAFHSIDPITPWFTFTIALAAIPLLVLARANRTDKDSPHTWNIAAMFGAFTALSWLVIFSAGWSLVRIHQMVRGWPAAAVFSFAFASVLAFRPDRVARSAAAVVAVAGLAAIAIGSTTFLEWFSTDRFVARSEPLAVRTISPPLISQFSVPFDVTDVRVSPTGRSIALATSDEDEETTTYHIGRSDGPLTAFNADDAVFLSDDRVLLLDRRPGGGVNLRELDVRKPAEPAAVREITGVVTTSLSYDSSTNEWILLGRDRDGEVVRVTGHPAEGPVKVQRWAAGGGPQRGMVVASSSQRALVVDTRYDVSSFERRSFGSWRSMLIRFPMSQSRLWSVTADGATLQSTTQLELQCAAVQTPIVVCAAFDGSRTTIFMTDDRADNVHPIGWVADRFLMNGSSSRGLVTGWWQNDVVALDLDARVVFHVRDANRWRVNDLAITDGVLAAAADRGGRTTITLYARRGDTMPGS